MIITVLMHSERLPEDFREIRGQSTHSAPDVRKRSSLASTFGKSICGTTWGKRVSGVMPPARSSRGRVSKRVSIERRVFEDSGRQSGRAGRERPRNSSCKSCTYAGDPANDQTPNKRKRFDWKIDFFPFRSSERRPYTSAAIRDNRRRYFRPGKLSRATGRRRLDARIYGRPG